MLTSNESQYFTKKPKLLPVKSGSATVLNKCLAGAHFQRSPLRPILRLGVKKVVEDPRYTPEYSAAHQFVVAGLITGWGVAESVLHDYPLYGGGVAGKRVIVQGWGNVGATAAYCLAQAGARVVGIIDRQGGLRNAEGFSFAQVRALFLNKRGNQLAAEQLLPFDEINRRVWSIGAEVFLPCAGSHLVTRVQVAQLIAAGLELVSSGANVPFADSEIFYGPIYEQADRQWR